jgi:hypothetical protein
MPLQILQTLMSVTPSVAVFIIAIVALVVVGIALTKIPGR